MSVSLDSVLADFDPDAPAGGDGLFGLPHGPDLARVVVIPVPFEATASYGKGTAKAPERVLDASRQVDLFDAQTGEPWRAGIAMLPVDPRIIELDAAASADASVVIAAGGAHTAEHEAAVQRVNAAGAEVNSRVYDAAKALMARGKIVGVLGGDHSAPFGAIRAAAERHPGLGILHVDAHADLREAYEGFTWSHASILFNVHEKIQGIGHIVQMGIRDFGKAEAKRIDAWPDVTTFTDAELAWEQASGESFMRIAARAVKRLPPKVWVTFDIDGLDPALCPATGTPVPGGLSWREALLLLQLLSEEHEIVGFDLCEVGDAEWDANVGARLLYKLAGWAIATADGVR